MLNHDHDIEKLLQQIPCDDAPSPAHRDQLEYRLITAYAQRRFSDQKKHVWRKIMKSKLTKLAAAAVVIAVLMVVYTQSGKIELATPAFGDVLQQIYKARSVIFKKTLQDGDNEPYVYRDMAIEGGLHRTELGFGMIQIHDFTSGKHLQLNTNDKEAFFTTDTGKWAGYGLFNYLDFLQNLHEKQCDYTGQEELDGKLANVFKNSSDGITVWVDPETNLPIKVKHETPASPLARYLYLSTKDFGGTDNRCGDSGSANGKMTAIFYDFEWNTELDPSLFNMEVPKGYTLRNLEHNVTPPAEEYLAKALSFWAEMSDGAFPDSIDDLGNVEVIKVMLIEKFNKNGDPQDEMDQAFAQWSVVYKGFLFAKKMEGLEYQGQGVQPGDADVPICWWKKKGDSGLYRVIYGDLRIADIAPEKLPR
jgi:hypothetical protein